MSYERVCSECVILFPSHPVNSRELCPCLLVLRGSGRQFLLVKCFSVNLNVFLNLWRLQKSVLQLFGKGIVFKNEF